MKDSYFHKRLDRLGVRMKELHSTGTKPGWSYQRGDKIIQLVNVTVTKVMMDEQYPENVEILLEDKKDIIIDNDQLTNQGIRKPRVGDIIHNPNGTKYQVAALNADQCFRYTSSTEKRIRIHTQIVLQQCS